VLTPDWLAAGETADNDLLDGVGDVTDGAELTSVGDCECGLEVTVFNSAGWRLSSLCDCERG